MIPKPLRMLFVILASALLIGWLLSVIYGSFELKALYYRYMEPFLKD